MKKAFELIEYYYRFGLFLFYLLYKKKRDVSGIVNFALKKYQVFSTAKNFFRNKNIPLHKIVQIFIQNRRKLLVKYLTICYH